MKIPYGARCRKAKMHDFIVVANYEAAQREACRFCGVRRLYHKHARTGRLDNRRYLEDHVRDTAQPYGRTRKLFAFLYGHARLREVEREARTKRRSPKDIWQETTDIVKTAKRLSFSKPGFKSGRFKSGQLLPT